MTTGAETDATGLTEGSDVERFRRELVELSRQMAASRGHSLAVLVRYFGSRAVIDTCLMFEAREARSDTVTWVEASLDDHTHIPDDLVEHLTPEKARPYVYLWRKMMSTIPTFRSVDVDNPQQQEMEEVQPEHNIAVELGLIQLGALHAQRELLEERLSSEVHVLRVAGATWNQIAAVLQANPKSIVARFDESAREANRERQRRYRSRHLGNTAMHDTSETNELPSEPDALEPTVNDQST